MRNKRLLWILLIVLAVVVANAVLPRPPKPEVSLRAEVVPLFGLHIPNSIIATWLIMLVIISLSYLATRRMEMVPGRLQNAVEWAVESLYNLSKGITGKHTRLVFPVVATLFFFILAANWMELLPGFGSVGIWTREEGERIFIPLLRSADTDLNTTIGLAIFAVGSIQVFGLSALGTAYLSRFLDIRGLFGGGNPMQRIAHLLIGLLELFDQFTKILSFSFRLFGNIFAGEVLLLVISFLLPIIGPLPFIGLEIFVGFIQALIFAMLTLVYASSAMQHEGQQTVAAAAAPEPSASDLTSNS